MQLVSSLTQKSANDFIFSQSFELSGAMVINYVLNINWLRGFCNFFMKNNFNARV